MKINKKVLKFSAVALGIIFVLLVAVVVYLYVTFKNNMERAGLIEDWDDSCGLVVNDISYGENPLNTFDLFIPANVACTDSAALMLFIHGGSWMGGKKEDEHYACRRYAKRGVLTASMNYSLLGHADSPEASIPAMLDEIGQCIERAKSKAAEHGINLTQASLSGTSAGGHLALLFAMRCGAQSALPIKFVAEKVGPVDMDILFPSDSTEFMSALQGEDDGKRTEVTQLFYAVTGRHFDADDVTWQLRDSAFTSVSPVSWVDSCNIPVLGAYGGKDFLVNTEHPKALEHALDGRGTPHRIIMFPNSGHTLADDPECRDSLQASVEEWMMLYFGL